MIIDTRLYLIPIIVAGLIVLDHISDPYQHTQLEDGAYYLEIMLETDMGIN